MSKKLISFLALEILIILSSVISFKFFINLQIAFLSSFFIILGSFYAYTKMVSNELENGNFTSQKDELDSILDPYELDDSTQEETQNLDFKAIVKEEKKKIKLLNLRDVKKGSKATISPFRLLPYFMLIIGFIALKNNDLLEVFVYLPSLLVGIIYGYIFSGQKPLNN